MKIAGNEQNLSKSVNKENRTQTVKTNRQILKQGATNWNTKTNKRKNKHTWRKTNRRRENQTHKHANKKERNQII